MSAWVSEPTSSTVPPGSAGVDSRACAGPSDLFMAPARAALVLAVDDDPASLKLLSEALAGQPFTLAVAVDGEMALRQIQRATPDLILLDAMMPGLDGFEVCRRLQEDPATRDIPILFMTSLADTRDRVRGLELGAVDYITKPFVREELVARVRTHLAIRAAADVKIRKAQDELAHLNRMAALSELAASIAHELNQPLAAILNNAQAAGRLLSRPEPDVAESRAAIADIADDARRAGQIIQRMRAMLKKGEPSADAHDLNDLAREVARLIAGDALLRGALLQFDLAPRLPAVRGDGVQLQQVLLNLLVNALDAVSRRPPDARQIVVRTRARGDAEVEISVEDSGEGIAPADLERIFEAFFTTKAAGLGVGLAISRNIVEAHGGRLWAESPPGRGATLRCALPAG